MMVVNVQFRMICVTNEQGVQSFIISDFHNKLGYNLKRLPACLNGIFMRVCLKANNNWSRNIKLAYHWPLCSSDQGHCSIM